MTSMKRRDLFRYTGLAAGVATVAAPAAQAAGTGWPVLPQKDTPGNRLARGTELAGRKVEYVWNTNFPTLPGIPLAAAVPIDDLPTLEWLVFAVTEAVDLFGNFVSSVLAQFSPALAAQLGAEQLRIEKLQQKMKKTSSDFYGLKDAQGTSTGVSAATGLKLAGIRTAISGPGGIMEQLGAVRASMTTKVATSLKGQGGIGDFGKKDSLDAYNAIWSSRPIPPKQRNIHDDELFAALRVEGANPMILTRVEGSLPSKFALSAQQYATATNGDSMSRALAEKRLFIADYEELGSMAPDHATYKLLTGEGWNSAPIALFCVPPGGGALQPVAIQVGQDPRRSSMFVRPAPDDAKNYWGWQMAKTVVQTADFNHHEMFVHLGRTHLVSEAFCVATNRQLSRRHPLNVLLRPHFEGDLWINEFAALVIMSPLTFGDIILAAPIGECAAGARRSRLSWDFYENMPPAELAARGVTDASVLPEYPYRDDALSVWAALHSWADDYVRAYYQSDADVTGDTELTAWVKELSTTGKIKGFRAITSVSQLVDVVAMIMFTASAQHAAVNYPQRDLMSYAPFASGASRADVPKGEEGHSEADWITLLPSVFGALAQMYFLNFLGGTYYRPLGEYRQNTFPYAPALTDPKVSGPLSAFQSNLKTVEATITARNAKRKRPYPYLLPSQIPTSTNI